jgi:phosphatidylinositol-3-phosphatase
MAIRRSLVVTAMLAGLAVTAPAAGAQLPPIRHVFVIVLENEDASTSFGPSSPAPYLAGTLPAQGELVPNYYGIGHASLDNYIAMISGQAPNPETQGDCPFFHDVLPGIVGTDGQVIGSGCVYPATVQTIADQLDARGLSWKGYMQDMGADPSREPATCAHPALNSPDNTESATAKDQYATRHDPFVYFHSIIDTPRCESDVVPLDALSGDLASPTSTPNFAFITPDLCNDGHDASCADGTRGGLPRADSFLREWVPRILASPAYRQGGLLAVIFDEAGSDSSACCGEQPGPSSPVPGGQSGGPGGGRTGAVLLSPYITPGSATTTAYNHYSLLRSIEDLFGLGHLGYAAADGLQPFGDDIFTSHRDAAGAAREKTTSPRARSRRSRRGATAKRARRTTRFRTHL